ncbi:hypothetical protein DCCM_4471 [Desulfocucumis palustris]|uniref:Uncharacterized protein n=1 Tax=Desulfocucumis palustris TaxID=1898651 RepID=A0A2L2XGI8_9FIRM|nr:hypothetical protein DCCM_4471 [Desulfocucumis palustris]
MPAEDTNIRLSNKRDKNLINFLFVFIIVLPIYFYFYKIYICIYILH